MHSSKQLLNTFLKCSRSSAHNLLRRKCSTTAVPKHLPLDILSEDELMMKQTVARFAKEQIAPKVKSMEAAGEFDPELLKQLFANGLMGIEIPTEYNGSGCNFMTTIQVIEEISKVDPSIAILVDIQNTLVNALVLKLGTEQQKAKYLPKLATAMCASFALSETTSGSDAFALRTTATRDGDHFVLNGSKTWISNSSHAGMYLVMANAAPAAGHRGITTFIVDRDAPGLGVAPPERKLGMCASDTCALTFDACRVHESQVLGELGHGYKYAAGMLNEGRVGIAAQMVGLAQGCLDATVPYTLERRQFGRAIFDFQAMRQQIARVATQIEAARLLTYNAARLVEQKREFVVQAAMAKHFAAEVAQRVTVQCIDWMGGVGFTKDFPQEKFYRDVKVGSIYEGTYNMQLNTIAKHIRNHYSK